MKYTATVALLALISSSSAHDTVWNRRHADIAHKRQASPSSSQLSTQTSTTLPTSSPTPPASSDNTVTGAPGAVPLSQLTSGMPTGPTLPVSSTYPQGAKPTYAGAPGLPAPFVFKLGQWPAQDVVVDTTSSQVQEWMKELDGHDIPDIPLTDGTCAGSPNSTANAATNGWWSCGGYTRATDITACPDKFTWGVSFDDGPAPYTQTLLDYLAQKDVSATFFVVGSRVIQYPQILVEEYMSGHEISVHTWSHRHLTTLTNEQIVGELGWTRAAIKAVLGVTPTTMRPPYGDIDDRVRAISLAMGMVPIIWTTAPGAGPFDTNDWRVAGGLVTGEQSFATFEGILGNASIMDTGFIVLQHDLYEITVDMAIGYTLNAALTHNPSFTLKPIGECVDIPVTDLYRESNTNKTFPYSVSDTTGTGSSDSGSSGGSSSNTGTNVSHSGATLNTPLGGMLFIFGLVIGGLAAL